MAEVVTTFGKLKSCKYLDFFKTKLSFNSISRSANYNNDNLDTKRKQHCSSLQFLGTFPKFRKAAIGFAMTVRMEQLGTEWKDFHEI
jgi:hypothetical protein